VVHFVRAVLGIPVVSKEDLSQRTNAYQSWVEAYARNHNIPLEWAGKGVRKENYVLPALRRMEDRKFDRMYCIDHAIPVSDGTIWTDLPKKGIPAEGKKWRERYVSLTLVFDYWATRRAYLEIRDARASDPHVDNRARRHRIAPRRRRYPPGFSPQKRTISSSRPHFFYTGRNPGSLHLLQAKYSSSPALTSHLDGRVTSRAA